jgi:hypothetical protein
MSDARNEIRQTTMGFRGLALEANIMAHSIQFITREFGFEIPVLDKLLSGIQVVSIATYGIVAAKRAAAIASAALNISRVQEVATIATETAAVSANTAALQANAFAAGQAIVARQAASVGAFMAGVEPGIGIFAKLTGAVQAFAGAVPAAVAVLAPLAIGLGMVAYGAMQYEAQFDDIRKQTAALNQEITRLTAAMTPLNAQNRELSLESLKLQREMDQINERIRERGYALPQETSRLEDLTRAQAGLRDRITANRIETEQLQVAIDRAKGSIEDLAKTETARREALRAAATERMATRFGEEGVHVPGLQGGGVVTKTGLAIVHAGEYYTRAPPATLTLRQSSPIMITNQPTIIVRNARDVEEAVFSAWRGVRRIEVEIARRSTL